MVYCEMVGGEWENKEGYMRITHAPEGHPWHDKLVCCDWDTFCTKCLDAKKKEAP